MQALDLYGLGVAQLAASHGGIASVAYGHFAGQGIEVGLSEDLGDQTHVRVDIQGLAVGSGYASAFLAPVLESEEAKKSQVASLSVWSVNPHNTTLFFRVVQRVMELELIQLTSHQNILGAGQPRVNRLTPGSHHAGKVGDPEHTFFNKLAIFPPNTTVFHPRKHL